MSTVTRTPSHHVDVLHPFVAALLGAAAFAVAMTAGDLFDLNSDGPEAGSTSTSDVLAYVAFVGAGVALAVWLGTRARAGAPDRLARYALGMALGSAATFVVFWTGWPQVLGAVAIALAFEHRRRIGGFSTFSVSAAALGALALTGSAVVCVVG